MENKLIELVKNKKVLFVATKNKDYIRITQEIKIVEANALQYDILSYTDKKYFIRFLKVVCNLLFKSAKKYDVVIVSFMPQMIMPFLEENSQKIY